MIGSGLLCATFVVSECADFLVACLVVLILLVGTGNLHPGA